MADIEGHYRAVMRRHDKEALERNVKVKEKRSQENGRNTTWLFIFLDPVQHNPKWIEDPFFRSHDDRPYALDNTKTKRRNDFLFYTTGELKRAGEDGLRRSGRFGSRHLFIFFKFLFRFATIDQIISFTSFSIQHLGPTTSFIVHHVSIT